MLRIALLDDYAGKALSAADWSQIKGASVEVVNTSLLPDEETRVDALMPFDIIVAMRERTVFSRATIGKLSNLKLLVTTGMRNNSIDMAAAREVGLDVCGTQMTPYAAFEHAWALLMSLAKNIPAEHQAMISGEWQQFTGVGLNGKTLGILGLGKLGAKMARAAQAFDMQVLAWSPNLTEERAEEHGAKLVSKKMLFEQSDFITLHMVLSDTTRGIVGDSELSLMRSSAYLINTSRGPLIDEDALVHSLQAQQIAGAGLDVYDIEPLPRDHSLRSLKNVVLTGHTGYVIQEMYEKAYGQALENILSWQKNVPSRVLN